jgi:hypothetical protein
MLNSITNAHANYAESLTGVSQRGSRLDQGNDSTRFQRMGALIAHKGWPASAHLFAVILAVAILYLFLSVSNSPVTHSAAIGRSVTIAAKTFNLAAHWKPVGATALVRFTR